MTQHVLQYSEVNAGIGNGGLLENGSRYAGPEFYAETESAHDEYGRDFEKLNVFKNATNGGVWIRKGVKREA